MDVLNRLAAQMNDLFKSMSPGARLTTGLLLVAVVVSLGYLFNAQSAGAEAFLLNGQSFTADELSNMEAAFGKAGLSDYTVEGGRVKVTKSRQASFLGALADAGAMPSRFGDFLSQAATGAGPFTPNHQREELMKSAKQKELALIIRSMAGIEDASVLYDSKKQPGLVGNVISTASVNVKPRGTLPLDEAKVPMIRSLVASAIAGLSPDNVTISDLNGGRSYHGKSGGIGSALDDPYLTRMRAYQSQVEARILNALANVPGVTVTANVELDREMSQKRIETKVDPKTVPIMSKTEENTLSQKSGRGPGGAPGLAAQQPAANQGAALPGGGGGNETEDTRSKTENAFTASNSQTTTELAGLTPKRTTVAIGIPSDYFEQVWQQRNPVADGAEKKKPDAAALTAIQDEETKKIRDHVAGLIPAPVDPSGAPIDSKTLVTVTTFSRVVSAGPVGPSIVEKSLDWLAGSWNNLAMLGLALVALLMLKSFVGAVPAAPELPTVRSATFSDDESKPAAAGATATSTTGEPAAAGDPTKAKPRTLQRKSAGGVSMKEELVEMVREDPEAAANILRSWIGNLT